MKLFTALALVTINTAAAAAANVGAADSFRSPSLVTADLVYVAADDADASSHQNDVIEIENQAHVADEVSAHFSEVLSTHDGILIMSHIRFIRLSVFPFPFD